LVTRLLRITLPGLADVKAILKMYPIIGRPLGQLSVHCWVVAV